METIATPKHQKCPDRISNLPEHIISYILSFLPTKSAVATTFLSKSWKLRWTKVTNLNFDDKGWASLTTSQQMGFVEFVNMVLINHSAETVQKFRLQWACCNITSVYLNIWVSSAIARNVRVLELVDLYPPGFNNPEQVVLPGAIYTCGTLEVLKLGFGFILIKLNRVACLPKLAVMELIEVQCESDESLHNLISGCPVLESLRFQRYNVYDNLVNCKVSSPAMKRLWINSDNEDPLLSLEINAPAVEFITLRDTLSTKISILDVASVNEVELDISCCTDEEEEGNSRADMIVGIVQAFRRAKYLKLSESTMIGLDRATNKLSTSFDRLTKLVLELDRYRWSCMWDVIHRCIKLEVLDILCWGGDGDDTYWRQPIHTPKCLSSSLRQVSFREFKGLEHELAAIKFILSHGSLMARVTLCTQKKHLKISTVTELCGFSRAFPACEISFS